MSPDEIIARLRKGAWEFAKTRRGKQGKVEAAAEWVDDILAHLPDVAVEFHLNDTSISKLVHAIRVLDYLIDNIKDPDHKRVCKWYYQDGVQDAEIEAEFHYGIGVARQIRRRKIESGMLDLVVHQANLAKPIEFSENPKPLQRRTYLINEVGLTNRQADIFSEIYEGKYMFSPAEIAKRFILSENTVRTHMRTTRDKLIEKFNPSLPKEKRIESGRGWVKKAIEILRAEYIKLGLEEAENI